MRFIPIFAVCLFVFGCGESYIHNNTTTFADDEWTYEQVLKETVTIDDSLSLYTLSMDLAHTTGYPYQNIYMNIYTTFPNGNRLKKQLNIDLANKAGLWAGDCNSSACKIAVDIQKNAYFNAVGEYTFEFEQFTRSEKLSGIQSLGFKVSKTGIKEAK